MTKVACVTGDWIGGRDVFEIPVSVVAVPGDGRCLWPAATVGIGSDLLDLSAKVVIDVLSGAAEWIGDHRYIAHLVILRDCCVLRVAGFVAKSVGHANLAIERIVLVPCGVA